MTVGLDSMTLDGAPIATGQTVMVLVGSVCRHHVEGVPAATLQALQGWYGQVIDGEQAARFWGPSADPEHTVCVRFIVPAIADGQRILGGWYAPKEVLTAHIDVPAIRARYGRAGKAGRS